MFCREHREGEEWQRLRKPVQHLLMKPQSVYAYIPIMEECADDFVTLMKETQDIESQEVPEFNHKMQRWTLECTCTSCLYGAMIFLSCCYYLS